MENDLCDKLTIDQDEIAAVTKSKSDFYLSLFSIIFTNLLLMAVALRAGLSITQLIWLYWCEGVIIGMFQLLKLLSAEITSVPVQKHRNLEEFPACLSFFFLFFQVPFHGFFAIWIYHIEPTFDYVHGLLMMGAIIFAHEIFFYLRDSRPWSEPEDLRDTIIASGIYFLRFIPLIALYYFMIKKAVGEGNKTLLTLGFMSFKLVSDVITHLIEERIKKDKS